MNFIKKHLEVGQLELLFKNLINQLTKTIVENNEINNKMYNLNFQRIVLKFHKLIIDFMSHITIKQNMYHYFDKIKNISHTLNQVARDRKARSSRTYDDQTISKFSRLTSSTNFFGSGLSQTEIDDKRQIDQIEQFMMSRNHLHPTIFGQMDQGFKSKSRNQLEQFLTHADIHAKNLQYQLKSSSNQRKKISNSFKLGGLSKNKLLLKKTTFDLQRINQLTKSSRSKQIQSESCISQCVERQDIQVQTILNSQNIEWNKILTYCLKNSQLKKYLYSKDSTLKKKDSQKQTQIKGSQINQQFQKQLMELFDPQIFGQYQQMCLINGETQTIKQNEYQKQAVATPINIIKPSGNNLNQKKPKATFSKSSNNQKRLKTKQKQSKANSTHTKKNQVQPVKEVKEIIQRQTVLTAQKATEFIKVLYIDSGTVNEYLYPQNQQQPTHTTFQAPSSPKSKKSMKVLELKELIFQYTSKKELDKKSQLMREQLRQKTLKNSYHNKSLTESNLQNNKFTTHEHQKMKTDKNQDAQQQRSYQTTINIEQGLVRRRLSKKNTWKGSTNSSNSILKSGYRLHQLKTDQNICLQSESVKIFNSKVQFYSSKTETNRDFTQQNNNPTKNKQLSGNKKQRRTSNFKQMYGVINKAQDKKILTNKRNTLDNLIIDQSLHKQFLNPIQQNFKNDNILKSRIQEQQFQTSYKNTQQKIKTNPIIYVQPQKMIDVKQKLDNIENEKKQNSLPKKLQVKIKPQIRIHHTQIKNQKKHIFKGKSLRMKTVQKQNKIDIISRTDQILRNTTSIHDFQNTSNIFGKKRKKHAKHSSQDLPQLSNCKQKLSDIKNIITQEYIHNKKLEGQNFTRLLKRQKINYNDQTINKIYSNSLIPTNNYRRILPDCEKNKGIVKLSVEQQQKLMNTIKKLFMTKSYRDKLLLYLSMIQVTHEKYCGKNCQHVTKFIDNLTGENTNCNQSVAQQLLRLYNNGKVGHLKFNKA